ncbi:MAG: hypothetical protein WA869_05665 [Alloacidobacterium sp.]
MAYAANYRRVAEAVLAIVATASMFYFGNGLNPLWPLMWIAPLPVLVFALRSKWWATAMVTVAAMLIGNLNMWSYLTKTLGIPVSVWVGIFLAASVVFAAGVLLFRALVLLGAVWSGLVALPAKRAGPSQRRELLRDLATGRRWWQDGSQPGPGGWAWLRWGSLPISLSLCLCPCANCVRS